MAFPVLSSSNVTLSYNRITTAVGKDFFSLKEEKNHADLIQLLGTALNFIQQISNKQGVKDGLACFYVMMNQYEDVEKVSLFLIKIQQFL